LRDRDRDRDRYFVPQAAGGFGRSTVNADAGAKTPLAGFISGIVMLIVLAALSPLFFHLPKPALGAIVIVAVVGLVDTKVPTHLYRTRAYSELQRLLRVVAARVQ
jgi:SulP family sulfate permease